jgi:N-acetylglucosaminyldiphosphoundecaprenol N-acetyl-beta-D-mannosaminyltransferase
MQNKKMAEQIQFLQIPINIIPIESLVYYVNESIKERKKIVISYVNVHAVNLALSNSRFHDFLRQSDIVYCDGFGVQIGARLLGLVPPPRYTLPDFIDQLIAVCIDNNKGIYLLGSKPGIAQKAANNLVKKNPGLRICGTGDGFFDKSSESSENKQVIKNINLASPAILFVGFGMPAQELWIRDNLPNLNPTVIFPVGAMLDYVAGEIYRSPKWMTDHGLEWLGRLIVEPRRLWKRYILGIPLFFFRVYREFMNNKKRK